MNRRCKQCGAPMRALGVYTEMCARLYAVGIRRFLAGDTSSSVSHDTLTNEERTMRL